LKSGLKLCIDWLKCTAKKLLKQRFDFPFEKEIETMDRLPKIQGLKIVKKAVSFPFENENETMDTLAKRHGQKIVKTMVTFSI